MMLIVQERLSLKSAQVPSFKEGKKQKESVLLPVLHKLLSV